MGLGVALLSGIFCSVVCLKFAASNFICHSSKRRNYPKSHNATKFHNLVSHNSTGGILKIAKFKSCQIMLLSTQNTDDSYNESNNNSLLRKQWTFYYTGNYYVQ